MLAAPRRERWSETTIATHLHLIDDELDDHDNALADHNQLLRRIAVGLIAAQTTLLAVLLAAIIDIIVRVRGH